MPIHRFYLSDFVTIQRQSFFQLLETGLIAEFSKRNPITNLRKSIEVCFYPEYYILTRPKYNPQEAILKNKSYISKLYVPVQFTDINKKIIELRWVLIGYFPIMTKRGHFILNGAARVIINQILRSPGVYYQQKVYENPNEYSVRSTMTPSVGRFSGLASQSGHRETSWNSGNQEKCLAKLGFASGVSRKEEMQSEIEMKRFASLFAKANEGDAFGDTEGWVTQPSAQKAKGEAQDNYHVSQKGQPLNEDTRDNVEKDKENVVSYQKSEFKRYYADLISMRGTWLRIEMDKEKNIWAQMKKGPKIPIYWFLLAMGLSEKIIFKSIINSQKLLGNLKTFNKSKMETSNNDEITLQEKREKHKKSKYFYLKTPPEAWKEISLLFSSSINRSQKVAPTRTLPLVSLRSPTAKTLSGVAPSPKKEEGEKEEIREKTQRSSNEAKTKQTFTNIENGRKWLYNRFMNPRSYDLGKQGRLALNQKLGLNIKSTQLTLTGLDVLYATDYLIKVEKGIHKTDDIDHLKNRRVRTSGELIQIQVGVGLVRLEKSVREMLNKDSSPIFVSATSLIPFEKGTDKRSKQHKTLSAMLKGRSEERTSFLAQKSPTRESSKTNFKRKHLFINPKAFNSAIREFFGTSPLSQFMDQINPLAELTHKRRLSSMGPGGVTRDSATLEIRGIHPTHYGRICPIETPEGKNTGLVNSMTTYARVNPNGIIESPFYKVFKGQVQQNVGMFFFSAEQEEKIKLAAADLSISSFGFLPKAKIPVRIVEDFTKMARSQVQYIGVSPLQMISIATSLIPFLEHDDANRALMGSNMQRQAVPLIRPERPIVGTGLEARVVSDSGQAVITKYSGFIHYVSANKIVVSTLSL